MQMSGTPHSLRLLKSVGICPSKVWKILSSSPSVRLTSWKTSCVSIIVCPQETGCKEASEWVGYWKRTAHVSTSPHFPSLCFTLLRQILFFSVIQDCFVPEPYVQLWSGERKIYFSTSSYEYLLPQRPERRSSLLDHIGCCIGCASLVY